MTPEQEAACLRYSFDADSKGDSGVRVMNKRMVKAAKPHTCFPCLGAIQAGERHRVERGLMDRRVGNCRTCPACCEAMALFVLDQPGGCDAIEARYTLGRQRAEERRAAA